MKPKKKSEWKSPGVIIAICGLVLSIITNLVQWHQNVKINAKANEANIRAEKEFERANALEKRKEGWLIVLKGQMAEIEKEITDTKEQLRINEMSMPVSDHGGIKAAEMKGQAIVDELDNLEEKKSLLQKQITDFVANY